MEKPELFNGIPLKLQNFLFSVQLYSGVCGMTSSTVMVKMVVILLTEKALTWWRSVSQEPWAHLETCNWATYEARIRVELQDSNHILKTQTSLHNLNKNLASMSRYHDQFRSLMLEIRSVISS